MQQGPAHAVRGHVSDGTNLGNVRPLLLVPGVCAGKVHDDLDDLVRQLLPHFLPFPQENHLIVETQGKYIYTDT